MPTGVYTRSEGTKKKISNSLRGHKSTKKQKEALKLGRKKGRKLSEEHKRKISLSEKGKIIPEYVKEKMRLRIGDKASNWKGSDVGYSGLHKWITTKLGKPSKCEHCGKDGLKGRNIGWANKDHKYKRILTDWIRLCSSCHKIYDRDILKIKTGR